ncbi:hypothetical protein [Dactylosporangium sp. NPDC051541]|uniref:hypothetical protein n=1 Tax=Dactylosporangium sp. NPDC051541 TaxID=3363977 RepID=UPI00379935CB
MHHGRRVVRPPQPEQLRQFRFGDDGAVPVVLVGNSLGGRAACWEAGDPSVTGVVGIAPWLPEGDPVEQLAGRTVLVLPGDRDRGAAAAPTAVVSPLAARTNHESSNARRIAVTITERPPVRRQHANAASGKPAKAERPA